MSRPTQEAPAPTAPATLEWTLNRRSFLRYLGAGAAAMVAQQALPGCARAGGEASAPNGPRGDGKAWVKADGTPAFKSVEYPIPIASDGGSAATDAARYATYTVQDGLTLPDGFRYDVVATYGDQLGAPANRITAGTAADYTGLVPVAGTRDEFWLIVNHEYISARPWLASLAAVHRRSPVDADGRVAGKLPLAGASLDLRDERFMANLDAQVAQGLRQLCQLAMQDLGVSVLHVRRLADGRFEPIADSPRHFRFTGNGAQNADPADMTFTGPAADLLGKPRGTFANCSGATTPWGTFLTCEENFQDQVPEFITPDGRPLPGDVKRFAGIDDGIGYRQPFEFEGLGTGVQPPLDGRQYGWVVEVDPVNRTLKKHTALGRFRHENVALRVEPGKRLAAYMGDDRRGGHVWKFVSDDVVTDPKDPANSRLLEKGTLYVARWTAEFKGRWVPLRPDAPVVLPEPEQAALGKVWLPARPAGGHVEVAKDADADEGVLGVQDWLASIPAFKGRRALLPEHVDDILAGKGGPRYAWATLSDLVAGDAPQAVLVTDAYVMANAAGGTPCARPEDIEVQPVDRSVYIAFTDSTGSGDGSPDVRIFPDSRGKNSRQYGAIYRLVEDGDDPAATTFTWGRFVSSGELAEQGGSFACADNLAFDPAGNLWVVTDITTPAHNFEVKARADRTAPGGNRFVGIFGNNALFMIPTAGPGAGVPHCFAIGPMESEMTGPTFTDDGRTLIFAIQHPGELHGTRTHTPDRPTDATRAMTLLTRDGKATFTQRRTVPLGSNFPSGKTGEPPRACVVCITRTT